MITVFVIKAATREINATLPRRRPVVEVFMRYELKQSNSSVAEEPNQLVGKISFAAVWMRVGVISWAMNRQSFVRLVEARERHGSAKAVLRIGMKRLIQPALVSVPPFRRYLAEKQTLQALWNKSVAERDALAAERTYLRGEIERQHLVREAIAAERDAERVHLQAELERRRIARAAVAAERDTLTAERTVLQDEVRLQRIALEAIAAERDVLTVERTQLQAEVERQHIVREAVAAERDTLTVERIRLQAELELYRIALEAVAIEPDALAAERNHLQAELEQQRRALEVVATERDALKAERTQFPAELERQRIARDAVVTECDALKAERLRLQADIERQSIALKALAAERDSLFSGQQDLLRQIGSNQAERSEDVANATRLQSNLEKILSQFQQERAQYQDVMLGKLVTVQSQFSTLQGSLVRLADTPKTTIADELSRTLYLDLLEDSLIGTIMKDESMAPWQKGYSQTSRELGRDWPKYAFTMIGKARMRNVREITDTILSESVPGDLLEAGVWRGGACIYMRGILKARGVTDRLVWVADSFAGLPPPDPEQYPADRNDMHHTVPALTVGQQEVRANFDRYGLLDGQVCFLEGWFKDTLPNAPLEQLALLRLDGDMYESTIQTLDAMYWKLSSSGFVIVDDYILPACKRAVEDFRARHGITAKLEMVDGAAVYWRKGPSERMVTKPMPAKRNRRE